MVRPADDDDDGDDFPAGAAGRGARRGDFYSRWDYSGGAGMEGIIFLWAIDVPCFGRRNDKSCLG